MRAVVLVVSAACVAIACSGDRVTEPRVNCVIRGVTTPEASYSMVVSQTLNVVATIDHSGCTSLPGIAWSTSDPAVVSVTSSGVVSAVGVGAAAITARLEGRAEQAVVNIAVSGRVMSIAITPAVVVLPVEGTQQLTAQVVSDPGTPGGVTWRSSDATRASVSNAGLVTALAAGEATITSISNADTSKRASARITVRARVSGVSVSPRLDTLFVTDTVHLSASILGDSGVVTGVRWRASNPAVATVNEGGVVTAVAMGSTEVVAESVADTTRRAVARIVVLPRVLSVAVTPTVGNIDVAGTLQLAATVTGDPGVSAAVSWASSNPSRATVTSSGLVTGVAMGTTTITVRSVADPSRSASAAVTVRPRVTGIAVTPSPASLVVGATLQLRASVSGDSGVVRTVTWTTSDVSKVTVSGDGIVTGVAVGSATVTARSVADPSRAASAQVTVVPRVTDVTISPATASLLVNGSITLVATVSGDPGAPTGVTWSSANPSIATVSTNGQVTAVGPGSVVITAASVADPTKSGTATITVSAPPPPTSTALCFTIPNNNGNQRVVAGTQLAGLTCPFESPLDIVMGQGTSVFPLLDGQPASVTWQVQPGGAVSANASPEELQLVANAPGVVTIRATSGGDVAQLAVRVLPAKPTGFCIASGNACAPPTATVKVGTPVGFTARAGGQGAAALWNVAGTTVIPHHLSGAFGFTPPTPGVYLVFATSTSDAGSGLIVVTAIP